MLEGRAVVEALAGCGVTHVVWIPDSDLGRWEEALRDSTQIKLIRATREGEAIAIAGGLLLGGARPVVVIQCTGFFEAGDALRNIVHDLHLPLFLIIGLRSHRAAQRGATSDTCPQFSEPIIKAWEIPSRIIDGTGDIETLAAEYRLASEQSRAGAVLIAE